MSARQEKVREALALPNPGRIRAALTEVEEWETRLATAEAQRDMALETLGEYRQQFNQWSEYEGPSKLAAAEAEADRLKAALEPFIAYLSREGMIYGFNEDDLAPLRALAPADRNTT